MSNEKKWTPSQNLAMQTHGRTILVSAAAGSGKTATLTERIIRRITHPEHPAELSRMLIVTFTRAAAAELKERISKAISEKIAADPSNRHLQKQLLHLGSAHIHTIDAFCYLPVKENFAEMGMPASFRIADEAELAPLTERIMGDLIDEFYQKYGHSTDTNELFSLLQDNPFADLCDSLTSSKNDASLIGTLKELYDKLLSFPEELSRLKTQSIRLSEQAPQDFFLSEHGRIIKEWMELFCVSRLDFLEQAIDQISQSPSATAAYLDGFIMEQTFLRLLLHELKHGTYATTRELMLVYESGRLKPLRQAEPIYVTLKDEKNAIVKSIRTLRDDYFTDSQESVTQQMNTLSVICQVLFDFLTAYDERMADEKNKRGICDFTDNRRKLLRMLSDEHGEPTPLCLSYLENFDEVYIDEYQDVDEVQDTIFRLIGGNHRFMVGDIKQSIYGFRGADPSVFAGYRQSLTPLSTRDDDLGNSIFMSENFRCDESVIRVTNAVCGHIFSACPDSIAYQPEDDLQFSKSTEQDYTPTPVHIALIDPLPRTEDKGDVSGVRAEAIYVANQIAMLLKSGAKKADGTPIEPKDIAILSRGSTYFGEYMKALAMLGIPTGCAELETVRATRDVLHGPDMMYLLNLMRVINNPDNDIPLSEVLRGEFPALTLDDVITVRESGDHKGSLFFALEHYHTTPHAIPELSIKIAHFLEWLTYYRHLSITLSAEGMLRVLRQDNRVSCRHTKAFTYLYDSARGCRVAPFVGLYTFLHFIENKILTSKNAPADEESQIPGGTVKLMTIHKSKGLEFPVCFVVRCGQAFGKMELSKDLLFEKSSGIATKLYDRNTQRKHDSLLRRASALAIKLQNREDEMRILYVAMTRARERLYLVGFNSANDMFDKGDRYKTLSVNNYLTWIKVGIEMHPEIQDFYQIFRISEGDITPIEPYVPDEASGFDANDTAKATYYQSILANRTPPTTTDNMMRSIPTLVPASQMSQNLLDECVFVTTSTPPMQDDKAMISGEGDFCRVDTIEHIKRSIEIMGRASQVNEFEILLKENARPTPAEKGTATHLFLQYCDWQRVKDLGLDEEISRLTVQGFISPRVAKILDKKQLVAFFESDFLTSAMRAVKVERELKFLRFVPLKNLTSNPELAEALGDRVLSVQGSIDIVCHYADGRIELCDYKTDRLTPEEIADRDLLLAHMKEKHGAQLKEYAAAIEERYGKYPDRIYIFSLPLGEALELKLDI